MYKCRSLKGGMSRRYCQSMAVLTEFVFTGEESWSISRFFNTVERLLSADSNNS